MTWSEARQQFPDTWLLFEALQAHTESGKWRVENLSVVRTFAKSSEMLKEYARLHQEFPEREFGYFHTSREAMEIEEQWWTGLRPR